MSAEVYHDLDLDIKVIQDIYQQILTTQGKAQLEWVQWSRYSNRQKQTMHLGGLKGHIDIYDMPKEFYDYLYLGQWLHTGKGSVFGLGQYQIVHISAV